MNCIEVPLNVLQLLRGRRCAHNTSRRTVIWTSDAIVDEAEATSPNPTLSTVAGGAAKIMFSVGFLLLGRA